MITATLLMSGLICWGLIQITGGFMRDFGAGMGAVVRLSALMTGALAAVAIWRQVKKWWSKRRKGTPLVVEAATAQPEPSPLLLWLALASIPITYVVIFASFFVVVGYSTLLFGALMEDPFLVQFCMMLLIIPIFLGPLVAAWAALSALMKLLFTKKGFEPAQPVAWRQRPALEQMVVEICQAVGTREPDNIILHIKPVFFVTQRPLRTYDGVVRGRTLAIGLPLLPFLSQQELKAVLAHEFAHFSGRDTLYSVWVAQVFQALGNSIVNLQLSRSFVPNIGVYLMNLMFLPAIWFQIIFYEYFVALDAILRRARELRADWIAASHFGSATMISALQKIVQYGPLFAERQGKFGWEINGRFELHYRLLRPVSAEKLQGFLEKAMVAKEGEYDSHPTLPARIGNLPALGSKAGVAGVDIQKELQEEEAALTAAYDQVMRQVREARSRIPTPYIS